jgi:hypothetical protein
MEIRVYEVQVQPPPGGWQDHEFEYDDSADLFRCVNCRRYESAVTADDGTLQPCRPSPDADDA